MLKAKDLFENERNLLKIYLDLVLYEIYLN